MGFMGDLKSKVRRRLNAVVGPKISGLTPGLRVAVLFQGSIFYWSSGRVYKYYDLASLTKVIFTVSAFMNLEEEQPGIVNRRVQSILPWLKSGGSKKIQDFLSHASGAPALFPVFRRLKFSTLEGLSSLNALIRNVEFKGENPLYSDVGYFVLGACLEELYNQPLIDIYKSLQDRFNLGTIHFNPLDKTMKALKRDYAPTEKCLLRKKGIQGESAR